MEKELEVPWNHGTSEWDTIWINLNCEESLQKIKNFFTTTPIQALPIEGKKLVYYDASHPNLGVLLIQGKNVKAYVSRKFKVHEKN